MGSKKTSHGGYRPIPLGADVQFAPAKATETILEAFRAAGANLKAAAENLGVTERTLHRYVDTLGIARQLEAIRERARREGWLKSARWAKP